MSAIRLGMPGSACTEEYGRSPHRPIAYLKLLSLPASLPAIAIPAATTATASTESPTARVFRTICLPRFVRPAMEGGAIDASLRQCRVDVNVRLRAWNLNAYAEPG